MLSAEGEGLRAKGREEKMNVFYLFTFVFYLLNTEGEGHRAGDEQTYHLFLSFAFYLLSFFRSVSR